MTDREARDAIVEAVGDLLDDATFDPGRARLVLDGTGSMRDLDAVLDRLQAAFPGADERVTWTCSGDECVARVRW